MKTDDPHRDAACPAAVHRHRGEGAAKTAKTKKPQKTGIVGGRKRGGQPGNRNAAKPMTMISRQVRDLNRRIRAALRAAERQAEKCGGPVGSSPCRSSFR
jgi:hypothetical protein